MRVGRNIEAAFAIFLLMNAVRAQEAMRVASRNDADVVFSGAENMMTDYIKPLADTTGGRTPHPGRIDESTIVPFYLRPVARLVRPGNPKRIRRCDDLLRQA